MTGGSYPPQQFAVGFQEVRRTVEGGPAVSTVQGVQQPGGPLIRFQTQMDSGPPRRCGGCNRYIGRGTGRGIPVIRVVALFHIVGRRIGKILGAHAEIRRPQPHQIAVGHICHGILQAEKVCDGRRRDKHQSAGLNDAGGEQTAAAVLRRTLGPVKQHGPAVLFQHRHFFCGIVDDRDPQIGEYRGRYIQIAVGPEGHGGIRHRQNAFLCRHEIHTARRFGRKSQLKQQQAAQQTHGPSLFHQQFPLCGSFLIKYFTTFASVL